MQIWTMSFGSHDSFVPFPRIFCWPQAQMFEKHLEKSNTNNWFTCKFLLVSYTKLKVRNLHVILWWMLLNSCLKFDDNFSDYASLSRTPAETANISDPISITRMLCGALILPTIATTAGKMLFGNVSSNFQRTLLVIETENLRK